MPAQLSPEQVQLIVGAAFAFVVANAGVVIGAYVSLRVEVAKLRVFVDILRNDVNNLGGMVRKIQHEGDNDA